MTCVEGFVTVNTVSQQHDIIESVAWRTNGRLVADQMQSVLAEVFDYRKVSFLDYGIVFRKMEIVFIVQHKFEHLQPHKMRIGI